MPAHRVLSFQVSYHDPLFDPDRGGAEIKVAPMSTPLHDSLMHVPWARLGTQYFRRLRIDGMAVLCGACMLLMPMLAQADTTITLQRSVQVKADAPITLGQIATLSGSDRAKLGGLVLLTKASKEGGTVELETIRASLEEAGVNWATTTLSGRPVKYSAVEDAAGSILIGDRAAPGQARTRRTEAGGAAGRAMGTIGGAEVGEEATPAETAGSSSPSGESTLRAVVVRRLASMYGVEVGDIRVEFEQMPAARQLDFTLPADVEATVIPQAATATTRLPLRVELRRGSGPIEYRILWARIELRKVVTVATSSIERNELISEDLVRQEIRWVSAAGDAPLPLDRVIGASTKRKVDSGRLISRGDIQPPIVVQRGDLIWVLVKSGSIEVKTKARAMAQARDGESVTMQVEGSKKTFMAKMEGRQAVAEIGGGVGSGRAAAAPMSALAADVSDRSR